MKILNRKVILSLLILVLVFFVFAIGWLFIPKLEGGKPVVFIEPDTNYLPALEKFVIKASDKKSGLKSILVKLIQDNKTVELYKEKDIQENKDKTTKNGKEKIVELTIEPLKFGFSDGKATLLIEVRDNSWRSAFKGNLTKIKKNITIDTIKPIIEVLTNETYISPGGTGLVVYKLNKSVEKTGVYIDDEFYPGYNGYFNETNKFLAFFALNYNKNHIDKAYVEAIDMAGNKTNRGFYYYIKTKKYKKDTIVLSDAFLNRLIPEFENEIKFDPSDSNIEKYLKINRELRKKTYDVISKLVNKTERKMYWEGPFLRFYGKPMAGFADDRSYLYNGKIVDRQTHLGVDIASVKNAPIKAANRGKIIFAGQVGIFGNAVVIDHGFGLFSLYGHMNSIDVKEGQIVDKGYVIGKTGMTGLAGGDHLHFSILVNKTYVNPAEWWDAHWIKNNITSKLQ